MLQLFLSNTGVHCSLLLSLIVVQVFFKRLPPGWWTSTFYVLSMLIFRGHKLQSHFVLIAERRARTSHVLLLCQLFSAARGCVWNFICSMEEWIVHLEKDRGRNFTSRCTWMLTSQWCYSKTTRYLESKSEFCDKTKGSLMNSTFICKAFCSFFLPGNSVSSQRALVQICVPKGFLKPGRSYGTVSSSQWLPPYPPVWPPPPTQSHSPGPFGQSRRRETRR